MSPAASSHHTCCVKHRAVVCWWEIANKEHCLRRHKTCSHRFQTTGTVHHVPLEGTVRGSGRVWTRRAYFLSECILTNKATVRVERPCLFVLPWWKLLPLMHLAAGKGCIMHTNQALCCRMSKM